MIILGLDTETTGASQDARNVAGKTEEERAKLETEVTSEIVEFGAVLLHVETKTILTSYGCVFSVGTWGENAEKIHKIPKAISDLMPKAPEYDPFTIMNGDMVDIIVAHNATHDHPLVTSRWPSFLKKPWLCTRVDLIHNDAKDEYGNKLLHRPVGSSRLGHLCVDYNIQLGNWHRALADAEACAKIAACHDLKQALIIKNYDRFRLVAQGSYIKNVSALLKDAPSVKAGGRRYQWDDEKHVWSKENLFEDEVKEDHRYIKSVTKGKWEFNLGKMPPKTY